MQDRDKKIVLGWREKIGLEELGIPLLKAKVDTGATTSSLHAINIEIYRRGGHEFVKFDVPVERLKKTKKYHCKAKVLDYRKVKSSNGQSEWRPVIVTKAYVLGVYWDIELTLTDRDNMNFPMLLGKRALQGRFLVDVSHSYMGKQHRGREK